jgi:very-short-patch-repair endonuclease
VLSGRAAAYLHGLTKGSPPKPEVSTPTHRRVAGIRTRTRRLDRRETTTVRGIPATTVARTLVDLAGTLEIRDLARAFHEADVRHGTTPRQVESVLERNPNVAGARKMRRVLSGDEPVTLSRLEREFLALLRAAGLPLPRTNRPAGTKRVDCRWPDHRLTIELDSYQFHRTRYAWDQDRRGEREARARRDTSRRYTHADVFQDRRATVADLTALLRATRVTG